MRSNNLRRWKPSDPKFVESEQDLTKLNWNRNAFEPNDFETNFQQPPPVPGLKQSFPYYFKKPYGPSNFGAVGVQWPSDMTHHSRLVIHNDPTNNSHLSQEDKFKIHELQQQIDDLKNKKSSKKVLSACELFENKNFN